MSWVAPAPSLVDGPLSGADRPILQGYLQFQRVTLLNICAGLTAEQLATRPAASSNLSLLGLIRHLAKVERIWFRQRAAGEPVSPMNPKDVVPPAGSEAVAGCGRTVTAAPVWV